MALTETINELALFACGLSALVRFDQFTDRVILTRACDKIRQKKQENGNSAELSIAKR